MAIRPVCDFCKKELTAFGGILFSPPHGHAVEKYHVCVGCFRKLEKQMKLKKGKRS